MTHGPIKFKDISFILPHKVCFADFSETIRCGQRIAVIGNNGSGKSTLLKILLQHLEPSFGEIILPDNLRVGYVPQVHEELNSLSGGQQFNHALSKALMAKPNLLILDEPTNHLDQKNRTSLLRMLRSFPHTLMVSSHDVDLLNERFDRIFSIEEGRIRVFSGSYQSFLKELCIHHTALEKEIGNINKQIKESHKSLMREQTRAKSSRLMGEKSIEQRKWPTIVSKAKAQRAETTTGHKKLQLMDKKEQLSEKLSAFRMPEIITPKFYFAAGTVNGQSLVSIQQGSVGFTSQAIVKDINVNLVFGDRIVIKGDNGSGKSTFIKAIISDPCIHKTGTWRMLPSHDIGYLDQNYQNLDAKKSILETVSAIRPDWNHQELRHHLNRFLFRKNEEVHAKASTLSGGERLRLSLCLIAARAPRLLLLDEVTNNVDLATKTHLIEVISGYQGALIVVSHDEDFIRSLKINRVFIIENSIFQPS